MRHRSAAALVVMVLLASGVGVRAENLLCWQSGQPIECWTRPFDPGMIQDQCSHDGEPLHPCGSDLGASSHNWYARKEYYNGTCPAGYEMLWRYPNGGTSGGVPSPVCAKDVIDAK